MILNPIHILRDRARRRRELEETIAAQIANLPAHYMPGIGPSATNRYLEESARVLKPGGRAIFTFFLLDDFARRRAQRADTYPAFTEPWEHGLLNNRERPEDAVAYDLDWVTDAIRRTGFRIRRISWGKWTGRERPTSYQDVIVATKR